MAKSINPERLKECGNRLGLNLAELADKSGVSKATLYRLAEAKNNEAVASRSLGTRKSTLDRLANALRVESGVLTGELPMPQSKSSEIEEKASDRSQFNVKASGAVRNSFSLVALRYSVPVTRIVEIAPVLFVIAAEASLRRRQKQLDEFEERRKAMEGMSGKFPHLPANFALLRNGVDDAVKAEQNSINEKDIFARNIPDEVFDKFADDQNQYDVRSDNPFVGYLNEMLRNEDLDEYSAVARFSESVADYSVCRDVAKNISNDNKEIAARILAGKVLLHEMQEQIADYKAKRRDGASSKGQLQSKAEEPIDDAERDLIETKGRELDQDQERAEQEKRTLEALFPEPSHNSDRAKEAPQ